MSITIKLPYHIDSYTILCEDEDIYRVFKEHYGRYCYDTVDGTILIEVYRERSGWRINAGGKELYTDDPVQVLHNILYSEKRIQPGIFALHAGAVCRNGKASVFAASTTSGKTTLITYLVQNGFEYVSDDCVFINMRNNTVYPYHNPIHLRTGGAEVLKHCGCLPESLVYSDERYIFTPDNLSCERMELDRIFFIERGGANETVLLSKSEALNQLLLSPIVSYPLTGDYIRFLSNIIPFCSRLRYRNMEFVAKVICC